MDGETLAGAAGVFAFLLSILLTRTILLLPEKEYVKQDAYFTPLMQIADLRLQALAARLGGEYVRGHVDWRSFATPGDLASSEVKQPNSVWRDGSLVRKGIDGYDIEVTYGVQSFDTRDQPGLAGRGAWDVFVPRFTVITKRPGQPFNRFDADWTADEELRGAAGRAVDTVLAKAFARHLLPMTPHIARARDELIPNAGSIRCEEDRVEVIGRPVPWTRGEVRAYGQGDFDVDSMASMIQRTIAFVQALEQS